MLHDSKDSLHDFTNGSNTPVNETSSVNDENKDDIDSSSKSPKIPSDNELEEFNWEDEDPEEKSGYNDQGNRGWFCCLNRNSSPLSWSIYIILTLISIAVCVIIFVTVKPQSDPTLTSYSLALWFTFAAFLFAISFVTQMIIEVLPWIIKRFAIIFYPDKTEVLRSRLSYYMALKPFIKLVGVGAWAWGTWSFLRWFIQTPEGVQQPPYVGTLERVIESFFLLALLLFIEKFILQLIATAFHKKAYGDRLSKNERALKILGKLKLVKRSSPQDFLMKRIKRPNNKHRQRKQRSIHATGRPIINTNRNASTNEEETIKHNVRFPSSDNIDTLIAIPPVGREGEENEDIEFADEKNEQSHVACDHSDKKLGYLQGIRQRMSHHRRADNAEEQGQEKEQVLLGQGHQGHQEHPLDQYENQHHNDDHFSSPPKIPRSNTAISSLSNNSSEYPSYNFLRGRYQRLVGDSVMQMDPIREAKVLARHIYYNILGPNPTRQYMVESDLYEFFNTHADAKEAFELFDTDMNGDISRHELRAGCVRIYRERKDLARSMRDMTQATGKLDIILLIFFACIWAIVVMAVFGVNVGTELMPLWSAFIAASFIFGNSAKDAFESTIFVFVTHPFDAGDRIFVGTENWTVVNVGLMVSTFLKWDGSLLYAKNSVLATQYIVNCRRTGCTTEAFDIQISYDTPSSKIHDLRDHMVEWANRYPKLYTPNSTGANIISLENLNRITITFYFEHTKSFQDSDGRWLRHNNFIMELKDELQRLDITYSQPEQPFSYKKTGNQDDDDDGDTPFGSDKKTDKPYSATSYYQNHAGHGTSAGAGASNAGNGDADSGAAAGRAATVAFTTAAI